MVSNEHGPYGGGWCSRTIFQIGRTVEDVTVRMSPYDIM